jgi:hypothetical protein
MSGFLSDYSRQVGPSIGAQALGATEVASTSSSASAASAASMAAGVGLMIGSLIGGAIARRKAKRRAELSMRRATISLPTPVTARRRVYGETRVAGDLKYWTTHGPDQEFVSLVYLLADHECESIVDVQFDNVSIGPLDGNGDVQDGLSVVQEHAVRERAEPGRDLGHDHAAQRDGRDADDFGAADLRAGRLRRARLE